MNPPADRLPRILLVEDDPVSAAFLRDAAASLPADVAVADGIEAAFACAAGGGFDLLLCDAHLPDGPAANLLGRLRERGCDLAALAHTASREPALHAALRDAGFAEVLCKPLAIAQLLDALRRHLESASQVGGSPVWDDAGALAALGAPAHVDALRGLFLQELPGQCMRIEQAVQAGDEAAVRAELHRLAASCGFVGAARLGDAVQALQQAPLDGLRLREFASAVAELPG